MTRNYGLHKCLQFGLAGLIGWLSISLLTAKAQAQQSNIVPDNTLGTESSQVITDFGGQPIEVITGGAIRQINLFHSFGEFNISAGRAAYFFSPNADIKNILTRVTGNNPSEILGRLGTFQVINGNIAGSNANLFLINPQGIVFGKSASLDLQGSFVATTANAIKFADGQEFSATPSRNIPLLTIGVPLGLQFGANPGKIRVQGDGTGIRSTIDLIDTNSGLRVPSNQTLALVAGDIDLEGATVKTAGGRIELGSLSGQGLVSLSPTDKGFLLGYSGVQNFGNIQLSQKASVDVSGTGAGDVQVSGKRVILSDGSTIEASTLGANSGGGLVVNTTELVELNTLSILAAQVYPGASGNGGNLGISTKDLIVRDGAFISTDTVGAGKSGNLTIATRDLLIRDGAIVAAGTSGKGNGGNLNVNASNSIQIFGNSANGRFASKLLVNASSGSTGNAGNLTITTKDLLVHDGAEVGAGKFSTGNGGNVIINANGRVELIGQSADGQSVSGLYVSNQGSTGNAGDLTITTKDLLIRDGAQVNTDTWGTAKGGNLTVNAFNVEIIGKSANGQFISGLSASTDVDSTGNAGDVTINTQNLLMQDGATVLTGTFGKGDGGNLIVNASGEVQFIGGGLNSSAQPGSTGNAGNITVKAQTINLSNQGFITSSVLGQGRGGKITLKAEDTISLSDGGTISSNSGASSFGGVNSQSSGDIEIRARKLLIDGGSNTLISSANLDNGKAGNIQIVTDDLISLNGLVSISSNTNGQGDGGNIQLQTRVLNILNGGDVDTSTLGRGNGGDLLVNASDFVNLSSTTSTFVDPTTGESLPTASLLATSAYGAGNSGRLTINTRQLNIRDGGNVSTGTTSQLGRGGELTINATDSVQVVGRLANGLSSFIATSSLGSGDAGDLTINTQNLLVREGAGVFVNSLGKGNAGIMSINANTINLDNNASLNANTRSTNKDPNREQATINLNTQNLTLRQGSSITTNATGENVIGGNINIDTKFLVAVENSRISANSDNSRGGRVIVNAEGVFVGSQPSDVAQFITATSGVGLSGTVDVNSPDNSSIQNSLTELSPNLIDTNALIASSCIARSNQRQENSFIITGSGALPANRPGVLISNYTTGEVRSIATTVRPWKKGDPIIEAQGFYRLNNGKLLLSRECS